MGTPSVLPGHAAIEVLRANRVDVVFGLNGDHVLALYDALADWAAAGGPSGESGASGAAGAAVPAIRHVTVKHENTAALGAEAYGRLTGRPGVALVTAGPGALNSISGVASARAAGAPVVHLSGAVPRGAPRETFHGVDDDDFTERCFAPVTKSSTRVFHAADIVPTLTHAFALAVAGRPGPVHVELTRDLLEGPAFGVPPATPAPLPPADPSPALDHLVRRLRDARRPLIVAGKGAWYPPASAALVAFAEALGAPVAHTWDGHAAMPTIHPLSLGAYRGAQSHPAVIRWLETADVMIGVGVRPGTEAAHSLAAASDRLILLDAADPSSATTLTHPPATQAGHPFIPPIPSVLSLAATLRALAESLRPCPCTGEAHQACAHARQTLDRGLDVELERHVAARPWHIGLALRSLDHRLTPDTVVTSDVSNVKLWAPLQLRTYAPHSHLQAGSWGTMGYALPAAIGASFALPGRRIVALAGDASFLMSSSDLVTLAQYHLPVVIAVHHDGRIGMIEYMQTQVARRAPYATEIGDVHFARYAEAAGIPARRVDRPDEIDSAWDWSLSHDGPCLLEFMAGHAFPRPSLPRLVQQGATPERRSDHSL